MSLLKKNIDLVNSVDYFMRNNVPFCLNISFERRSRFVILDYSVDAEEFTPQIYYDKEQFGHLIDEYEKDMIRAIKVNRKLNDADWDNSVVFVDECERIAEYFEFPFFLTVKTYQRKTMSSIDCAFKEFKDQCKIHNALIMQNSKRM